MFSTSGFTQQTMFTSARSSTAGLTRPPLPTAPTRPPTVTSGSFSTVTASADTFQNDGFQTGGADFGVVSNNAFDGSRSAVPRPSEVSHSRTMDIGSASFSNQPQPTSFTRGGQRSTSFSGVDSQISTLTRVDSQPTPITRNEPVLPVRSFNDQQNTFNDNLNMNVNTAFDSQNVPNMNVGFQRSDSVFNTVERVSNVNNLENRNIDGRSSAQNIGIRSNQVDTIGASANNLDAISRTGFDSIQTGFRDAALNNANIMDTNTIQSTQSGFRDVTGSNANKNIINSMDAIQTGFRDAALANVNVMEATSMDRMQTRDGNLAMNNVDMTGARLTDNTQTGFRDIGTGNIQTVDAASFDNRRVGVDQQNSFDVNNVQLMDPLSLGKYPVF